MHGAFLFVLVNEAYKYCKPRLKAYEAYKYCKPRIQYKYSPSNILKNLYYSLIYPYLKYAIEAWYGAPQCVSNRVKVIQKKAIRAIFDLNYNSHTTEYFTFSGILKLRLVYKFNLSFIVFKSLSLSDKFSNNLRLTSDLHN